MIYRLILPQWAFEECPDRRRVLEGEFTSEKVLELNSQQYYNAYYLPNYPSHYEKGVTVDGSHIDKFEYVFVDMDLKEDKYATKQDFISYVQQFSLEPSRIVDSGNGVHVYWRVTDLDAMSFLKLQRRLLRHFKTDEAVAKIYQLMRVPGTVNTKKPDDLKLCEEIYSNNNQYTCEQLDTVLPQLAHEDEEYCKSHYNKTYKLNEHNIKIDDKMPVKFASLLRSNKEVKEIWSGNTDDRSKSDYRLGHIMWANGFTKEDAASVLVNTDKAMRRSPVHRVNYAMGIIDKIWTMETTGEAPLSESVRDILNKGELTIKGTRFPCYKYIDATQHGFRLGQVIGLVAGSGVGKTAMALNMFMGFVESNPDYIHFFIPLEQPANEIADRWRSMCGANVHLHDKVHVMSNYAPDGSFRRLSFDDIKDYLIKFQKDKKQKIGCVVIDHIAALKKSTKDGENQGLMDICHAMKAFAIETNTMLVMQSQAPREKAGIGDLELNKDAAYGTVYFESYCDYLISIWQPLKRVYSEDGCPTVTAFKFCKIRHKKVGSDEIQEDSPYLLYFDPVTERLCELTQSQKTGFDFFAKKALNHRQRDKKSDLVTYCEITWTGEPLSGTVKSNTNA